MALDFFAMPEEQRLWIGELISDGSLLCAFFRMSSGQVQSGLITDQKTLAEVDFAVTEMSSIQFYVGRPDLVGKACSQDRFLQDVEVNFTRVRAIRITASRIVEDRLLLDGQIAVMEPIKYKEAGVDPEPIRKWYQQVKQSLQNLMDRNYDVTMHTTAGIEEVMRGMSISPGAVEWRLSGKLLKQFPRGAVEFDVKKRDAPRK